MGTVSRQSVTEILDEVFEENLIDFVGRKALVSLRNTVLDRMEEAGLVDAPAEDVADEDDVDEDFDDDAYDDWDDDDEGFDDFFDKDED